MGVRAAVVSKMLCFSALLFMRCPYILLSASLLLTALPAHAARHRHARHSLRHVHRVRLETERPSPSVTIDPVPLRRVPYLPPLKGSYKSLVRQNERNESEGLKRIADNAALMSLRRASAIVPLPVNAGLRVDERLPGDRRYCRPWTARFLVDLGRAHAERFHRALQVNSAVRTVTYQRHLLRVNGNAAPAEGDVASPHLTGATVDIAKKGLSNAEVAWMRAWLSALQAAGKIDVEEEFQQACFHITVYKAYVPQTTRRHAPSSALLAAAIR